MIAALVRASVTLLSSNSGNSDTSIRSAHSAPPTKVV
jgi:hypothetical protein